MNFSKPEDTWKQRRDPFEVGNNVVVPLLKKRGITKLDYVMITHQDLDHIGGMQAVLEEIPVRILVFNGTIKNNEKVKTLFRTALSKGVILREAAAGDRIQVDSHTYMDFLLPNRIGTGIRNAQEQNRLSLVFMLVMYESRFLFTGDMEAADERLWLAAAAPDTTAATAAAAAANPSIDVLKIAHHGSKTSTSDEWLVYWRPKLAVISVGKSNTYGHPNPLVLDRLKQYEVPVLRTDRHGEVQVRVTEKGISVRSKRPFSHQ